MIEVSGSGVSRSVFGVFEVRGFGFGISRLGFLGFHGSGFSTFGFLGFGFLVWPFAFGVYGVSRSWFGGFPFRFRGFRGS